MTVAPQPPSPAVVRQFLTAYVKKDWSRALGLVERGWTTLIFSHETFGPVCETVSAVTEEQLRQAPRAALVAEAVGRLPGGTIPVTMPGDTAAVARVVRAGGTRATLEVAILAMIARRATGRADEALAIAHRSRELLRAATMTRSGPAADLAAYWHLQAAQAALHAGDLDQAMLDFHHAWSFRSDDVTGYVANSTAPFLALLATLSGDTAEADLWHAEVDRLRPENRGLLEWRTMERPGLVARLLEATDRLDTAEGGRLTEQLLQELAFDEIWPVTLFAITRHLVNTGAAARAGQLVETTAARHAPGPGRASMHHAFTTLARADVALALGRSRVLGSVLADMATDTGAGARPTLRSVYAVYLHLLEGDITTARQRALVTERRATTRRVLDEVRLLRVAAELALGLPTSPQDTARLQGPLRVHLRRAAALLPPEVVDRIRHPYVDDVVEGEPEADLAPEPTDRLPAVADAPNLPDRDSPPASYVQSRYRRFGATG